MRVIDASALIELLMMTTTGYRVAGRVFAGDESLHAPELIDLEVAQVTRRYAALGDLGSERGHELLQDLQDFAIERYSHRPLLARIWELRENLTAYDAAYVALAELLEAPLLTCDRRLAAAPHQAAVEVL